MCIFSRKSSRDIYKKDYKHLSNRELDRKLDKILLKKKRNTCFSGLYIFTTIGSIATSFVTPIAAISTIPASVVSTVAAFDSIDELNELEEKEKCILEILKERRNGEVIYYDNKSSISIIDKL